MLFSGFPPSVISWCFSFYENTHWKNHVVRCKVLKKKISWIRYFCIWIWLIQLSFWMIPLVINKLYSLFCIQICDVIIHTLLSLQGTCIHLPLKIKRDVWLVIEYMVLGDTTYTCWKRITFCDVYVLVLYGRLQLSAKSNASLNVHLSKDRGNEHRLQSYPVCGPL